jgi:hypothetical protein
MIVALLAAVIGQPLDAEFTTPEAHGVSVSVRHPAAWKPQAFAAPHGVARIVAPDGRCEARLWVTDELTQFAARGQDQAAASAEFDFVDSGKLLEPFVTGNQIVAGGTTHLDGRPARFLEVVTPNGARQYLVGMLAGRRGVILAAGAAASSDFEAHRAMLSLLAQSLRIRDDLRQFSWSALWLVAAGIVTAAIVVAVVRIYRRRQPATPTRKGRQRR